VANAIFRALARWRALSSYIGDIARATSKALALQPKTSIGYCQDLDAKMCLNSDFSDWRTVSLTIGNNAAFLAKSNGSSTNAAKHSLKLRPPVLKFSILFLDLNL
jgi:hypothetical protein